MPHGAKPSEAQTGWAKGGHRKRRHPSGQEGYGKAETSWTHVHAMQQMGMGQDKPKCCKLDTQSQILILQWKKAAEKVLGGGADLDWTVPLTLLGGCGNGGGRRPEGCDGS